MWIFRDESNSLLYDDNDVDWRRQRINFFLYPIYINLILIILSLFLAALVAILFIFVLNPFFIGVYLVEGKLTIIRWIGAIAVTALICMFAVSGAADLFVIIIYNFYWFSRISYFRRITDLMENQRISELKEIVETPFMTKVAKNKYLKKVNGFIFNTFREQRFAIAALVEIGSADSKEALQSIETDDLRKGRLIVIALQNFDS